MSNPAADDAISPVEEPTGRLKRFYKKFKTPINLLLSIYAFLLVCATLLSFPAVRAQLYPVTAIFQSPSYSITSYAPVFTTAEKPSFLVSSSKFLNYEFRVYDVNELNQFAKPDLNDRGSYRENVPQGTKRFPCENFNYGELCKSTNNFSNFKPIATAAGPIRAQDLNCASMLLTLAEPLKPGDYLGVIAAPGSKLNVAEISFARFRVTDLGAVLKHDDDKILVSTINLITRKPWTGAQLSLRNEHDLTDVVPASATDGNGIGILNRPADCSRENWQALVLDISSGAHGAYFGRSGQYEYFHGMSEADNFVGYWPSRYRAYLNTDRPVYRLGQTINFRGFVKKVSSNGLTDSGAGTELKMAISDPDGRQIKEESVRLDAAGGFSGIIKASESTKTGVYNVNIMYPDQQSEGFGIPVQQYRKPDFKVDVTPVKSRFERGDRVRFKIHANYLFGAPLKDAKIKYRVSSSSNEEVRERLSERVSPDSLFFKNWESSGRYSPYGDLEPYSAEGEIQTDGSGTGFVEFDVPVLNVENKQGPYQYKFVDSDFNVSVETTDLSRKTFTAEGHVPVSNGSFALIIDRPSSSVTRAGEPIAMKVKAIDYDKKTLAGKKVKAKLCRWKWTQELFGDNGHYTENVIETIDVTTDKSGVASVSFKTDKTFPSDSYYVTCESFDERKRTVGDVTSVWLFGAANDYYMSQRSQEEQFSIELDKEIYRANETIKAIVKAPLKEGEDAYVLTSIEGPSLRAYKQIKMTGPVALVEFPVDATYMPNAFITASFVMPEHKPVTTSAIVKVSPLQNFVNLNVSTDKPQYKPGETVKYTVTAKTNVGKAVANMPLAASVIDEGIFQVFNDLKKTIYVGESQSDIFASIYRRIENEVLTRFTFTKKHDELPHQPPVFDGAGLLALHMPILMFTPYNYSRTDYASCDMVAKSFGAGGASRVESAERPVAAAPMPTEGGAAKKALRDEQSAASAASSPAPRVRSNFVDTAAWYPGLFTNAAGSATFSVKLPDDLTTWRATVYGATTGIDVGMQTNSVICTQDFLARLALPRFYTEHDETTISGLIHNLSLSDQAVNVSLATSSNIQLLDGSTFRINVPRDGAKRQSWKIKVLKPGVATITLKAVGSTLADAEERKLPVRPFGYRVYFAKNGLVKDVSENIAFPLNLPTDAELSNGAFDISASASAIGPVLGNFEKLIEYPYGCTEQTLSRLIPSVVAKRLSSQLHVQMDPRMSEKFNIAYKMAIPKLSEYQHDDGGWGWWRDDHSDPYMTAHVLEGYYLLKQAGMRVDEERIERARVFLRNSLSSLTSGTWGRFESENQAKAVYALSLFGDKMDPITRAWQFTNIKSMTPEALSYLIMAFQNVGDKTAADQLYERLKELRTDSLEYSNWEHNPQLLEKLGLKNGFDYTYRFTSVETTALALRASVRMEPNNDELLEKVTRWLILERDENGWNNTKTTAAVFLALLEKELGQDHNRATKFTARLEALNSVVKEFQFNHTYEGGEQSATIPLDGRPSSISLKKNGPGWLYYNTLLAYDRRLKPGEQPVLKSVPADLKVKREWFRLVKSQKSKPGRTLYKPVPLGDNESIKVGDIIKMVVSVDCPFAVPYSLVEAFIPSGGEILAQPPEMEAEVESEVDSQTAHWYWWTHQDVLDDRIAFFASEMPSGDARFTAYVRMEMPGNFNVNPVHLEGMYTDKVHARSKAQLIRVVE